MVTAGLLSSLALRPIEAINAQLELLSAGVEDDTPQPTLPAPRGNPDTVVRVAKTIDRLERQMRSKEAGYTALKTNLNQMLDTLRDGVVLFAGDVGAGECRAVMVSDAVANFIPEKRESAGHLIGKRVEEIFAPESAARRNACSRAFESGRNVAGQIVLLEDGRQVQISLDQIQDAQGSGSNMGTLLTLRDMESAMQLERELEVSRRLAAIGRITAGVGHEVKNPINAMVLHLELLRNKLANGVDGHAAHSATSRSSPARCSASIAPCRRWPTSPARWSCTCASSICATWSPPSPS